MEFILSSEDFDADTAEAVRVVNRSIPDAELDDFVYRLARRIASFNPAAIAMVQELHSRSVSPYRCRDLPRRPWPPMSLRRPRRGRRSSAGFLAKARGRLLLCVELDLPKTM